MRDLVLLSTSTLAAALVPLAAQSRQTPAEPLRVPVPLAQPTPRVGPARAVLIPMEKATLVTVPGRANAAANRARLNAANARIRPGVALGSAVSSGRAPAILRVNGATRGTLEPGGSYQITGRGFGDRRANILLRTGGRAIALDVQIWSDETIYAAMPADVAGLPDGKAEIVVGRPGQPALTSDRFGFFAAREDVSIPIDNARFTHVGAGTIRIAGGELPVSSKPTRRGYDGDWYNVERYVRDDSSAFGNTKKCFLPGTDRISRRRALNPGFEQTGWLFERNQFRNWNDGSQSETKRGAWNFRADDDAITIDFGVIRHWRDRDPGIIGSHGSGGCHARYKIRLIATGPRGMPVVTR